MIASPQLPRDSLHCNSWDQPTHSTSDSAIPQSPSCPKLQTDDFILWLRNPSTTSPFESSISFKDMGTALAPGPMSTGLGRIQVLARSWAIHRERTKPVKMVLPAFPCVSVFNCCPFWPFLYAFQEHFLWVRHSLVLSYKPWPYSLVTIHRIADHVRHPEIYQQSGQSPRNSAQILGKSLHWCTWTVYVRALPTYTSMALSLSLRLMVWYTMVIPNCFLPQKSEINRLRTDILGISDTDVWEYSTAIRDIIKN